MIELLRSVVARAAPAAGPDPLFVLRHGGGGRRDTDQAIVLDAAGRPVVAVKIARGARGSELLRAEHARLAELAATLLLARPGGAPRPLALEEIGGRSVLVETFVPGRRMKDLDPGYLDRRSDLFDEVADWLGDFARACGLEPARGPFLEDHLDRPIEQYLAAFESDPAERAFLRSLPGRIREAMGPDAPTVAVHGDFTDANVLVGADGIGVVDWDEPVRRALPGGDLVHFLASTAATRFGLDDPERFRRGFLETFFEPTRAAARARRTMERYRTAVGFPRAAIVPLFALAWVRSALHKLDYLDESGRRDDPASSYPVTFFDRGRCLNVALAASRAATLGI